MIQRTQGIRGTTCDEGTAISLVEVKAMERITLRLCASVLLVLGLVLSSFTNISAKEPEEIWQELGKLPGAERQKRLVVGAKAESTAVLYSNISEDNIQKLRPDFEKRYPVKLDSYRASGERIA